MTTITEAFVKPSSKLIRSLYSCVLILGCLPACGGEAAVEQGTGGGGSAEPVACGDVTCTPGQLCLLPPSYCDYGTAPPHVAQDDEVCANIPAQCSGQAGDGLVSCLEGQLCTGVVSSGQTTYEAGLLSCGPAWYDCF